ncbi:hypothetical protein LEP1GSC036_0538 [Leptospira weilii str. 2006001853]|uniref:Uncharacterized protein n=4 Tax=Leptospira TaxID=171 RepID=A0A828Z654_9LEPT|nr:hypothetical protein LEP1GSC036_0538 [Leptospira weilii str. 2006001853]EMJ59626.1 hypothetical protein LEP1GSC051_3020 [Leptospira sp. P2653]EMM71450.1 hypothetical protein LEP1GSC038_4825 [Leptospira weilii str. 2006001855]EMN89123.1 hypothetical protein LEP1GSC108_0115 [Leptospira weilii str. UI 13098]EQA61911.1 hypothetical protein LEP1GSC062_4173 [Leptospira alexanderi serovar Manhao 3 str. L 60]
MELKDQMSYRIIEVLMKKKLFLLHRENNFFEKTLKNRISLF